MSRAPLDPGTWGEISCTATSTDSYLARVRARREDGSLFRKSKSGRTKTEAKRALIAAVKVELTRRDPVRSELGPDTTVSHLAAHYIADPSRDSLAVGTIAEENRITSKYFVNGPLGAQNVERIRVSDVKAWFLTLRATPSAARNGLIVLRKLLDIAVEHDLIQVNVARTFRPKKVKQARVVEAVSVDDFAALRAAIVRYIERDDRRGPKPTTPLLDVLDVMIGTSARIGEAVGLRWTDVNLAGADPTVAINGTVIERAGAPKFYQQHPKSEAGRRTIRIPKFVAEILAARREQADPDAVYVFETKSGRPNGPQDIHRMLRNVEAWAGLSDDINPHDLRRTVATLVAESQGIDAAARTLGHSRSRVTEKSYIQRPNLAPDSRSDLQGYFDAALGTGDSCSPAGDACHTDGD